MNSPPEFYLVFLSQALVLGCLSASNKKVVRFWALGLGLTIDSLSVF